MYTSSLSRGFHRMVRVVGSFYRQRTHAQRALHMTRRCFNDKEYTDAFTESVSNGVRYVE